MSGAAEEKLGLATRVRCLTWPLCCCWTVPVIWEWIDGNWVFTQSCPARRQYFPDWYRHAFCLLENWNHYSYCTLPFGAIPEDKKRQKKRYAMSPFLKLMVGKRNIILLNSVNKWTFQQYQIFYPDSLPGFRAFNQLFRGKRNNIASLAICNQTNIFSKQLNLTQLLATHLNPALNTWYSDNNAACWPWFLIGYKKGFCWRSIQRMTLLWRWVRILDSYGRRLSRFPMSKRKTG